MTDTQPQQLNRDELEQRVRELEQTVDDMSVRLDAFSRRFDNLRDLLLPHPECPDDDLGDADTMVELIEDTEEALDEQLESHKRQDGKRHSQLARRITAAEEELNICSTDSIAMGDGGNDAQLTKLDRLIRYGADSVSNSPTATMQRAKVIGENIHKWGRHTSSGIRLSAAKDDVKQKLEAALDSSLSWTQVYRAMELVDEWSDSRVSLREGSDGEGRYVLVYSGGESR